MSVLLQARGLGKRYTLRPARSLLMSLGRRGRPRQLWALRDLDLDLCAGEVVAIVGRNGAGKSTLLKLASGVTVPTTGTLRRPRRIAPLIEVGAGFHPELTGRENVEVNGRLLGMSRGEIRRKFDDIVAFSELAHAIDQPIKEYSSGMFMRLGFSVAVHTEPELLVVDEVLAVGDMPFQVRCLDRIRAMRDSGVGVLFVSHNLGAVLELADRAVLLEHGNPTAEGDPREVVGRYHASLAADTGRFDEAGMAAADAYDVEVVSVTAESGDEPTLWLPRQHASVSLRLRAVRDVAGSILGLRLSREGSGLVAAWHQEPGAASVPAMSSGEALTLEVGLDLNVTPGAYLLEIAVASPDFREMHAHLPAAYRFAVGGRAGPGMVDVNPTVRVVSAASTGQSPS
ncbi:MAG TPA: polysaccharide ABC transporter ATP-binding protein [Mycobacteriales bacterium]|nr:polysaccharide ABC transporter ATP-binding protein [Mycobacteriales bacterium]